MIETLHTAIPDVWTVAGVRDAFPVPTVTVTVGDLTLGGTIFGLHAENPGIVIVVPVAGTKVAVEVQEHFSWPQIIRLANTQVRVANKQKGWE